MTDLHRYVAYAVPAGFLVLALWSALMLLRNKEPGARYWGLLAGLQVVLGIEVIFGGVLFAFGNRPHPNGPVWLHYVYGGLFPVGVLVFAHLQARKRESIAMVLFGAAALVNFGLTFRALQTGLGVD